MAKPIRSTPILRGEDAKRFLDAMVKKNNSAITEEEKKMAEAVRKFSCEIIY